MFWKAYGIPVAEGRVPVLEYGIMLFLLTFHQDVPNTILRVWASPDEITSPYLRSVDVVGFSPRGEWTDVLVSESEIRLIESLGFRTEVLIPDVREYNYRVMGSYRSTSQVFSDLVSYATSYPTITRLDTIGTTYEGRPIMVLRITDNPDVDEGEPGVLITGLHHAREWPTVEITMFAIDTLLRGYGSDPDITSFVNNLDIYVIPLVNPDGYYYSYDLGNTDWRKNRHYFPEFGTYGVDDNRNYGGADNGDPRGQNCTPTAGTTNNPSDEVYCGPGPFSESETDAIRQFVESHPNLVAAVNYHTYTGAVLYPWGYTTASAPDATYLYALADSMASQMVTENNNPYTAVQAPDIGYTATADSDDWEYGHSIYVSGYPMVAFTVEACEQFRPPESELDQIVRENWKGLAALLRNAPDVRNHLKPMIIVDSVVVSDTVSNTFDVSATLRSPYMNPTRYALRYFTSYSYGTDDAETSMDLWTYDGFSRSSARAHGGSYSFAATYDNRAAYHMTTRYPYFVRPGDSLTFWVWYDVEENYDAAFVEISTDGRAFRQLEKFTGNSGGWVRKAYDLSPWAGKWVFFRFRFVSDAYVTANGFFVDDVSPVPDMGVETVVDTGITTLPYTLTLSDGIYYLQMRGYSTDKGWGDWSSPRKVVVGNVVVAERERRTDGSGVKVYTASGRYVGRSVPDREGIYFVLEGRRVKKVVVR